MTKLSEVWKSYEFYTGNLTEHNRKLAFAIAAICWFFKTPEITFPFSIFYSLMFVVLFLFFDFLQYLTGALIVGGWARHKEKEMWKKEGKIDGEVSKPAWLDIPVKVLFIIKNIILLVSVGFLVNEFLIRITQNK